MKKLFTKINIFKFLLLLVFALNFAFIATNFNTVYAQCPPNVVPNPLDPDCRAQGQGITIGFLINRFIVFLPAIIVLLGIVGYGWGAAKMILGGEDGKEEAIKMWVQITIGLMAFFSMWLILFLVSIITGFDLLAAIGQ